MTTAGLGLELLALERAGRLERFGVCQPHGLRRARMPRSQVHQPYGLRRRAALGSDGHPAPLRRAAG